MLYYFPERIYNVLKHNTDIMEEIDKISNVHLNANTMEECIITDSKTNYTDKSKEFFINLDNMIKDALSNKPILLEEYKINDSQYNIDEMITKYNTTETDIENKFYLLSNICNQASTHDIRNQYLREYVKLFESIDDENKKKLSKYIPLKYMYSKAFTTALDWRDFSTNWEDKVTYFLMSLYMSTMKFTKDKDITLNYLIETIRNVLGNLEENIELFNNESINILTMYNKAMDLVNMYGDYQYRLFSWGYLNCLDFGASMYLMHGDKKNFIKIGKEIAFRINYGFLHEKELLRGLSYYDKVNHNMYCLIVRKWLRILDALTQDELKIYIFAIEDVDKEYILSDRIGTEVTSDSNNLFIESSTVKEIDKYTDYLINRYKEL